MGTVVETDAEIGRLMDDDRTKRRPALRHGPLPVFGRRSGNAAQTASRPCRAFPLQGCAHSRPRKSPARRHELHGRGAWRASSPCRATARSTSCSLLRPLAERGYEGWFVVEAEQDPAKAHPLTYATKGCRSLLATAEQAGFDVRTRDGEMAFEPAPGVAMHARVIAGKAASAPALSIAHSRAQAGAAGDQTPCPRYAEAVNEEKIARAARLEEVKNWATTCAFRSTSCRSTARRTIRCTARSTPRFAASSSTARFRRIRYCPRHARSPRT